MAKKGKKGKKSRGKRPGPTAKAKAAYNGLIRKSFVRLGKVLKAHGELGDQLKKI